MQKFHRLGATLTISVLLAACGSSGSSSSPAKAAPKKAGSTDPGAHALAQAAVPVLPDLGAGWKSYKDAVGFSKLDAANCSVKSGSPVTVRDETYTGATLSDDAGVAFIYGSATVFRTAQSAKAYTALRATKKFTDCKQAQDDAAEKTRTPADYVKVVATTDTGVGQNGLEAYYREEVGSRATDGTENPGGNYARYTFRQGRVVFVIDIDAGSQPTDAANTALGQRASDALGAAVAKINQRITAAG